MFLAHPGDQQVPKIWIRHRVALVRTSSVSHLLAAQTCQEHPYIRFISSVVLPFALVGCGVGLGLQWLALGKGLHGVTVSHLVLGSSFCSQQPPQTSSSPQGASTQVSLHRHEESMTVACGGGSKQTLPPGSDIHRYPLFSCPALPRGRT